MQFRINKDGKLRNKTRPIDLFALCVLERTNLLTLIHYHLQKIEFEGKMWLVFSKDEERILGRRAEQFFPHTSDRPAIFLNCILTKLKEMRKETMFATYITTNPSVPLTDVKPHQVRLAIQFERQFFER